MATAMAVKELALPRRHNRLAARTAIILVAALASGLTLRATAGGWLSTTHPQDALAMAPGDARVQIAAAIELSKGKPEAANPRVQQLVGEALERDVTDPRALELLALADDRAGHHGQASALFRLSDLISRRSLPTRLWLIQQSVDAGDVKGALRHFDIALRTSPEADPLLFPVLARAAGQPGLARPVAALLDQPSDWRLPFFHQIADGAAPEAAPGLTQAALAMHDRRWLLDNHIDDLLIASLVTVGAYQQATQVSRAFHPASAKGAPLLHDGNFADASQHYPFGWQLEQRAEMEATRATINGKSVLRYDARSGGSGVAATQLLQLAPGRYRLSVRVAQPGADRDAQPFWTLTCAGEAGSGAAGDQIALLEQTGERNQTSFVIGREGCAAQWISLHLRSSDNNDSQSGAISAVAVEPLGDRNADSDPPR